ncbi:hypothetical protein JCM10212_001474 [Sporobolomyces blumeae]
MASTPPINAPQTLNPASYLHLAPSYAYPTASTSGPTPSTSTSTSTSTSGPGTRTSNPFQAPPNSASKSKPSSSLSRHGIAPYTDEELRNVVLEYLLSGCYAQTAKAFAFEVEHREKEGSSSEMAEGGTDPSGARDAVDGMQGVEATPEPEGHVLDAGGEEPTATDKSVAFASSENGGNRVDDDFDDAAAGGLSRESLREVRLRQTIQDAILTGRIAHAKALLYEHYPAVLAPRPPSSDEPVVKPLPHQRLTPEQAGCTPSTFFVLPPSSTSTTPSSSVSPVTVVGSTFGSWATSLAPEIIRLNLQLQAFIELMRTGHATSSLSTPSTPTSSHAGGGGGGRAQSVGSNGIGGAGGASGEDVGMSSSIASLASSTMTTSTSLLSTAIASSQELRASVQSLPPSKDKEHWEREIVDACGLLAYKDVATCPVRGYLDMSRREGLAEMVNSAILQHTSRTPMSILSLAARQASAIWETLGEMKVQFPPTPSTSTSTASNGATKTRVHKTYPRFDFAEFVSSSGAARSTDIPMTE